MKTLKIKINYATPLLMNSTRGLNAMDAMVKEKKTLTSKKSKTEEDQLKIAELSYKLSAYYNDEIGFYIPAEMLEATIREGAKANKNGKKVCSAVEVNEMYIPLQFKGPKTLDEAWSEPSGKFIDARTAVVMRARIMVYRPRFDSWSLEFTVTLDDEQMTLDEFKTALEVAGATKGIGTFRPKYGRFNVAKIEIVA